LHYESSTIKECEMASSSVAQFSNELSAAAAQAGNSVVAVFGRRHLPSSGTVWRNGVVVTANHAIDREEEISVLLPGGKRIPAKLTGRDPGTDLAALRVDSSELQPAKFGDPTNLKLANFVLALGRTRAGNLVASSGIVGGVGGEWRTWRGGRIDQSIRLDLELYPGFSGGPLVAVDGKVLGVNTSGLGRGRAVTIPVSTIDRTVDELLQKGRIARPYLGVAMQPVRIPESVRGKLKSAAASGQMILHVESGSPADDAGIVLGDVIVELQGRPALEYGHIRGVLADSKIGDTVRVTVLRAQEPKEVSIKLAERAAK
jgi:S1-C subfamily serine protease